MKGVKKIVLDGQEVEKIPAMESGTKHEISIVMG